MTGFAPIQNYTTLKQKDVALVFFCALYPYKITLLSNGTEQFINATTALYPYKITLLSNNGFKYNSCVSALYPYKITLLSNKIFSSFSLNVALYPYKITLLSNLKYLRKTAYEPFVQFCKNICYIFNMLVFYKKETPAYLISLFVGYSSFIFIF